MKRGIALIFLTSIHDGVLIRNIEFRNPANFIDIKNRSILELPDYDNFGKVAEEQLLFNVSYPSRWHVPDEDFSQVKIPEGADSTTWNPVLRTPEIKPEVTLYSLGQYESSEVLYDLIAVEASGLKIALRNCTTILGGPRPVSDVFLEEPIPIRRLLRAAGEKHSFQYLM